MASTKFDFEQRDSELRPNYTQHVPSNVERPSRRLSPMAWRPGVLRRLPWLGFGCLLLALLLTSASAVVLIRSNGQLVADWQIRPAVLIAIFTPLSNALARMAFRKGVTISWWTRALQGSTVKELHQLWSYGHRASLIALPGKKFWLLAIASVLAKIIVVEGPLLQRASVTTSTPQSSNVALRAQILTNWSLDYETTLTGGRTSSQTSLTPAFVDIIRGYSNRVPISRGIAGCYGICTFEIAGAGFAVSCGSTTSKTDNSYLVEEAMRPESDHIASAIVFATAISDVDNQLDTLSGNFSASGSFQINITFSSAGLTPGKTCPGIKTLKTCIISPGTVVYPVSLANNTISLLPPPADGYRRTAVPFHGANVASNLDPLGGFQTYLGQIYGSNDLR